MKWCSECGGEHRDGASECAFCGDTLVEVEPSPPAEVSHELVSVDIAALDDSQRSVLRLLITSNDLHVEIDGDRAHVVVGDAPVLEALVLGLLDADELDPGEAVEWQGPAAGQVEGDAPPPALAIADGRPVASTGVRVGAWLIEVVVVAVATGVLGATVARLGGAATTDGWWVTGLVWIVEVTLVARYGWDPGKLVLGLRVVGPDGRPPSWTSAAVRSLVMIGPFYALTVLAWSLSGFDGPAVVLVGAANVVAVAWLPWLLWTVADGPKHQGWHDRAAGTYVVEALSTPPVV